MDLDPRPIAGSVGIRNFQPEHEKPSRWSFMKVLREHSDLKEYYPEIDPFAECFKVRHNTYAIFSPSIMPGCGDVWSYLIIGPDRALLIDTAFGLGDLKKLSEHLAPGRVARAVRERRDEAGAPVAGRVDRREAVRVSVRGLRGASGAEPERPVAVVPGGERCCFARGLVAADLRFLHVASWHQKGP